MLRAQRGEFLLRFNGAALIRARKSAGASAPAQRKATLQRGRAHSSAEICTNGSGAQQQQMASTGPRSFERGNRRECVRMRLGIFRASTGPRSFERGNLAVAIAMSISARASTGPRSFERGNGIGALIEVDAGAVGFNGAALIRARKYVGRANDATHTGCFNGAALIRARKSQKLMDALDHVRNASTGPRSFERGNPPESSR